MRSSSRASGSSGGGGAGGAAGVGGIGAAIGASCAAGGGAAGVGDALGAWRGGREGARETGATRATRATSVGGGSDGARRGGFARGSGWRCGRRRASRSGARLRDGVRRWATPQREEAGGCEDDGREADLEREGEEGPLHRRRDARGGAEALRGRRPGRGRRAGEADVDLQLREQRVGVEGDILARALNALEEPAGGGGELVAHVRPSCRAARGRLPRRLAPRTGASTRSARGGRRAPRRSRGRSCRARGAW